MKNRTFALVTLAVLAILAALLPSPPREGRLAFAAGSAVVLLNGQAVTGAGLASVSSAATPTEDSSGRWTFLYACRDASGVTSAACGVHLEISLDSGTSWTAFHRFTGADEVFAYPTCGVCSFRAWADDLGADHKATLTVAASGGTAALAPTYTATPTPTLTPTHA